MQEGSNEDTGEVAGGVAIAVKRVEGDNDEGVVGQSGPPRRLAHSFY